MESLNCLISRELHTLSRLHLASTNFPINLIEFSLLVLSCIYCRLRHCLFIVAPCRYLFFLRFWTSWLLCNLRLNGFKKNSCVFFFFFFAVLRYMDVNDTLSSSQLCWVENSWILMKHLCRYDQSFIFSRKLTTKCFMVLKKKDMHK